MAKVDQKAVLIVIDGWGVPSETSAPEGNAILNAETPWMDEFKKDGSKITQGYTELEASSLAVGLPEGLMGNSEVGHLNIGAGRVVWQDVVRIDQTIKNGELNKNEQIVKSFTRAKEGNGRLHLLGLVSDGGVVSLQLPDMQSGPCIPCRCGGRRRILKGTNSRNHSTPTSPTSSN